MVRQTKVPDDIGLRAKRTLEVFEQHEIVYFYDLPPGVGPKTMAILVERGLVQLVDERVGPYAKGRAWRLLQPWAFLGRAKS